MDIPRCGGLGVVQDSIQGHDGKDGEGEEGDGGERKTRRVR